jgi:hypothetical protein
MGYRMILDGCATSLTRRTPGAAGAADMKHFAPLRHLRHPLIGEGKVPQWRNTASRAAHHTGGATAGWRLRLADHDARLLTARKV